MAEAAFSFAVQKLGQLAIQKVGFLQGVEAQVKWLKDELETMQCFLKDTAEKQADNQSIRKWISDIRDLAQDADDVIETFILKIDAPRRSRGLIGRFVYSPRHVYHLDRVGEEIERIRSKLEALAKSRERYGIEEITEEKSEFVEYRRRLSPWQKDKQVVGMEEDVESLLRRGILEEREGLSIASIVGMGGIGKSTLARVVYNHAAVAGRFERRAWICVSSDFKEREIIKELVMQLVGPTEDKVKIVDTMEKLEVASLREMLYKRLQGTRYFVVVDDVWEEEHWECLATVFPCEEDQSSRLLLTSRNRDITKYARYVHEMKILDPNKSWQLFLNKAFMEDTNGKCPQDLENIGRKILKKCNGLPLAITVVGGLLAKQRQTESEWEKVLKGMNSHLGRGKNSVSSILELSYHNLPPKLKSCFLCLAFFKEDATIRVEKLVHVWIAQGLVPQEEEEEETIEEIARSYLDKLINRNMVQVKEMSIDDHVKSCCVHDLLREVSIAKAKEEISFEILRDDNSQSFDKPRHRVVNCSAERRVLDFEDFGLNKLPGEIGSLVGLRPMPSEKLPKLLYLKLNDAYVGSKMVISHDGFPRLKILCLRWMLHLRNMKVGKGGISQLKRLEIHECQDLYLPEELRFMTNVRE
ncbi:hypothetical protein DH2020_037881 [Rehmannia glutinosa]|uniref:Uncharacterized protein n=1 Tax=Rehmannia glutinosa TaxID=99300 RepID=A0ABR0V1C0_REHGL